MQVGVLAAQLCASVPGGTGRYTAEVIRALVAPQPGAADGTGAASGRSVTAILPAGCAAPLPPQVPVARVALPLRVLARVWERGLPPRIGGVDLVHAPTLLVPPVASGTRLVVTIHDLVPWTHPQTLTARGVAFHHRMGRRAAARADLLLTPSEVVAAQVREVLRPQAPVLCVTPGATPMPRPPDAEARRRRLQVPADYVLFVGTAEPRKGLDVLLAALAPDGPAGDLHLVVVGPRGWGEVDVAGLARRAGLTDRVHLVGRVEDLDLAALLHGASALALPSRAEGFGLPVLEALAVGVPVVTSDDPALLEAGGGATLSAPIGDAQALAEQLHRVVTDPRLAADLRARGSRRAQGASWERMAERLWELYRATVG